MCYKDQFWHFGSYYTPEKTLDKFLWPSVWGPGISTSAWSEPHLNKKRAAIKVGLYKLLSRTEVSPASSVGWSWNNSCRRSAKGDMHSITHGECSRKSHDGHRKDSKYCPQLCEYCSQLKMLVATETMELLAELSQGESSPGFWTCLGSFLNLMWSSRSFGGFWANFCIQACVTLNCVGEYTKMSYIRQDSITSKNQFHLKRIKSKDYKDA